MANGYLGKISAIVTANTSDYSAKLGGAARETAAFARSVQSEISRAMSGATKSLQGIYTPLQRLERSLQAAGSMTLSFKGFNGLIKDVETLQARLGDLSQREVNVALKASGLKSINDLKAAVQGLTSRDIELTARFGGLEQLQQLQQRINSSQPVIDVQANVDAAKAKVESLRQQLAGVGDGVKVTVGAESLAAMETRLASAREAVSGFLSTIGSAAGPKKTFDDLNTQLAAVSAKLVAAQNLQEQLERRRSLTPKDTQRADAGAANVAALQQEEQRLSGLVKQMSDLRREYVAAKRAFEGGVKANADATSVTQLKKELTAAERQYQKASAELSKAIKVNVGVDIDKTQLDQTVEALEKAGVSPEKIQVIIEALGLEGLAIAQDRIRQLASTSEQIQKPLQSAAQKLAAMAFEVQGSFNPALTKSQAAVERLNAAIESGAAPTSAIEAEFAAVKRQVDLTVQSVSKLAEASAKVSSLRTGRELQFAAPALNEALERSGEVGSAAAALPASAISANPRIAAGLETINRLSNEAVGAYARLQRQVETGLPTASAQRNLDNVIAKLRQAQAETAAFVSAASDSVNEGASTNVQAYIQQLEQRRVATERLAEAQLRAQAASRLLVVDQRESDLMASEGDSTNVQAYIQQLEQRRVATERLAEAQLRAQAASRLLVVDQRESDLMASEGASTPLAPAYLDDQRRRQVDATLGREVGSAGRQFDLLQSKIISVQGSIESLPTPLQAQFIPDLLRVRQAFATLPINATADQIQRVAAEARTLGANIDLASDAAKRFGSTYAQAFQSSESNAAAKKLQFLQNALISSGVSSAQAEEALEQLRLAYEAAASSAGGFANAANRAAIASAEQTAVGAVAGATGGRANRLAEDLKRAGDVGRGGFDKFSLAANQAAFAVDDFLSSTGGIEFKLRAISNNITQLAFILGGTTGLFIGLGAVIGGQAAVGLLKWINGGRSAEDQTKALNDALARQKSLVEELAQAFRSLGDSVTRGVLSAGAESAADFKRQVEDIRRKQRELSGERAAATDVEVQKERALQNSKKRELEKETNVGRRIVLGQEIQASERRDRALTRGLAVQPIPDGDAVARAIRNAADREIAGFEASVPVGFGGKPQTQINRAAARERAGQIREIAVGIPAGSTPEDIQAQIRAAERAIDIRKVSSRVGFLPNPQARFASEDIEEIQALIARLRNGLDRALNEAAIGVFKSAAGAGETILQAQNDVAEAIRRGVPAAAAFQREVDALGTKLKEATAELDRAENDANGDPMLRQQAIGQARKRVAEVEAQQAAVQARAREVRLGRTVGGERATSALSRIEGDERFRNELAGITASLRAAIDAETAALGELEAARKKDNQAEMRAAEQKLEVARRASEVAAALAETAVAIEGSLARIRKIGESALQRSEQAADAAQRSFEDNPLRGGAREARDNAEGRLINDRAEVARAQAALDQRRSAIQQDPRVLAVNGELEAITQRRKDLEAKANLGGLNNAERDELASATAREIELIRQREQLARQLTEAERRQLDAINNRLAAEARAAEVANRRNEQADPIARRQREAGQIAEGADREAENARQRFVQNPTADNARLRAEAESRARQERARGQEIEDRLDARRREIEGSQPIQAIDRRIAANDARLQELAGISATRGLTSREIAERDALQAANRQRRSDRDGFVDAGLADVRADIDRAMIEQVNRERALRGRDLGMTERERNRKEIAEGVGGDINARAAEMRGAGEDPAAFLRQALANQMEQMAPMLYQFQQNRENAMLQGPSRAALKVNDVSTTAGAAELTRLLRGDDSAKDVNLAELRKQTMKFDELITAIKQQNPGVLL